MKRDFATMLEVGGKSNSLGNVSEVVGLVLQSEQRLDELYDCIFDDDPWVRMRAVDAFEKVCRVHPDWVQRFVERFPNDLAVSSQPSIQWHLAQIYAQVDLTGEQKAFAISWLKKQISTKDVDWIVAANVMATLSQFATDGSVPVSDVVLLLEIQKLHNSSAVRKRANKLLSELT